MQGGRALRAEGAQPSNTGRTRSRPSLKARFRNFPLAVNKALWGLVRNHRGEVNPVFVLGVQRSGTSMLMQRLSRSSDTFCYTEARNSPAFKGFQLEDLDTIRQLCAESRQKVTVFKPLMDSHRARGLLQVSPTAKVIWVFRRAEDRAASAVAKFGDTNLRTLRRFVRGDAMDTWQAGGLSEDSLETIRRFDYESMDSLTAAALFWYIRNRLFLEQGLDSEQRAFLLSYESVVSDAPRALRAVCNFLGCSYHSGMSEGIHARSVKKDVARLPEAVAELCNGLYEQLTRIEQVRISRAR